MHRKKEGRHLPVGETVDSYLQVKYEPSEEVMGAKLRLERQVDGPVFKKGEDGIGQVQFRGNKKSRCLVSVQPSRYLRQDS